MRKNISIVVEAKHRFSGAKKTFPKRWPYAEQNKINARKKSPYLYAKNEGKTFFFCFFVQRKAMPQKLSMFLSNNTKTDECLAGVCYRNTTTGS